MSDTPKASLGRLYTATGYSTLMGPAVEAYLYNPSVESISLKYPYKAEAEVRRLEPTLSFAGHGLPDGAFTLTFRVQSSGRLLHEGATEISVKNGWFEAGITLPKTLPTADSVAWTIRNAGSAPIEGVAPLRWSRFYGQVKYLDSSPQSTTIDLMPVGWNAPHTLTVPVTDDGRFDEMVPSRIYSALNCCGAGYAYDCLERWGWDYDLTRDRYEVFTIGRMELYGIHAYSMFSPLSLIFIQFRPSTLSRALRFDLDGDGVLGPEDKKALEKALTESQSPTCLGPELSAADVKVWLDGKEERIVQFNQIPEYNGAFWQVQYLLQISPDPRPERGVWHEIKLEVRSRETLRGREIIDFGEGSVGYFRP